LSSTNNSDDQIGLSDGRDFLFSPHWGNAEPSALFDCNSGDYWIVTEIARCLVETLAKHKGAHNQSDLAELIALRYPGAIDTDTLFAVVEELIRLDILQPHRG